MVTNSPYVADEEQRWILERNMKGKLPYTLMNDFLCKYSLQKDLFALTGLVAALLQLDVSEITDLEVLNPIEPAETISEKSCVLDLKLEINSQRIVNVEIQSRRQDFWPERSITYLCRNFNQLRSGEYYDAIKPCIQIGILNHSLFRKEDPRYVNSFFAKYRLMEVDKHTEYSSKFEIRVLSLSHTEEATEEERSNPNGLYHWGKLFKASSWEELKMTAKDNPRMESFVGTIRKLTADDKVLLACENRLRYSNEIATYEHQIEKSRQEADAAKQEADAAKQEADAAKQEADAAKQETAAIKKELDEKDALIAQLKAQLAANQ